MRPPPNFWTGEKLKFRAYREEAIRIYEALKDEVRRCRRASKLKLLHIQHTRHEGGRRKENVPAIASIENFKVGPERPSGGQEPGGIESRLQKVAKNRLEEHM